MAEEGSKAILYCTRALQKA